MVFYFPQDENVVGRWGSFHFLLQPPLSPIGASTIQENEFRLDEKLISLFDSRCLPGHYFTASSSVIHAYWTELSMITSIDYQALQDFSGLAEVRQSCALKANGIRITNIPSLCSKYLQIVDNASTVCSPKNILSSLDQGITTFSTPY